MNAMLFFWFGFRIFLIIQRRAINGTTCGFKEIGMTFVHSEMRGLFRYTIHIIILILVLVTVFLITIIRLPNEMVDLTQNIVMDVSLEATTWNDHRHSYNYENAHID